MQLQYLWFREFASNIVVSPLLHHGGEAEKSQESGSSYA